MRRRAKRRKSEKNFVAFGPRRYMYWMMGDFVDNRQAVERVVQDRAGWVFAAARRRVRDTALAEDVAQAVFLLYWRRRSGGERPGKVVGWLHRAVRYCSANALRLKQIQQRHEREAAMQKTERTEGMEQMDDWTEVEAKLEGAMDRLSEKDREVVLLRFYEQRPLAEVGQALGISEKAAQKRVERAVGKLREMLEKKGVRGTTAGLSGLLVGNVVGKMPAGLVEKIVLAVGSGGGNGVAAGIAKGAMKMMTYAKVKVAVVAVVVAASVFAAVAQVTIPSGSQAPAAVPTRTEHGETVRDAKIAGDEAANRILQEMIAKRAARPPVAMDLDVRMKDHMGQQWGQEEASQHVKVALRQDGRRMDAVLAPADDAEGRNFGLAGRGMWDGSRFMSRMTTPHEPARRPQYALSNKTDGLELIIHRPWVAAFADAVLGTDPASVPEMMLQSQAAKVTSQRDPVGGLDCILLEATGKTGIYRMWVEPKSLMPQKIVYEHNLDDTGYSSLYEVTDVRTEQVGGHWIVTQASKKVTAFRDGKNAGTHVSHVIRSNIVWNSDFTAIGAFVMDYPKDAMIKDIDQPSVSYQWVDGKPIPRSDADLQ